MAKQRETVDRRTLALWIRKGSKEEGVEEDCDHTLMSLVRASTLGLALIGKYGSKEEALKHWTEWEQNSDKGGVTYTQKIAELLNVPFEVIEKISRLTYASVAAREITRMLEKGEISF